MGRLKRRRALPRGLPLPLGRARPAEWARLTPSLPAPPRAVRAARSPGPRSGREPGNPGAAAMGRARPAARRSHSPDPAAHPAPPRSRSRTLALLGALVAAVAAAAAARAWALLADAQAAARQVSGDRRGGDGARGCLGQWLQTETQSEALPRTRERELGRLEGTAAGTG